HGRWLGEVLLERDDVVFCEVKTGEDEILFRGGTADGRHTRHYSFPVTLMSASSTSDGSMSEGGIPETQTDTGTLSVALSAADTNRPLTEARGTIIVAVLTGTAVAVLFVTLIVRRAVGNSVTRLLNEATIASAGYLRQPTASAANDEFEQLAGILHSVSAGFREAVDTQGRCAVRTGREPASVEHVMPR
ncbi:MAG: hypothetical protein ACYTAS_13410, partial [Planctomycetota bacterium]